MGQPECRLISNKIETFGEVFISKQGQLSWKLQMNYLTEICPLIA